MFAGYLIMLEFKKNIKSKTKKLVEFCKKNGHISPTFEDVRDVHSLFSYGHRATGIMQQMITNWKNIFIHGRKNHYLINAPCMIAKNILEKSGHLKAFDGTKDSGLFELLNGKLYLRPETAQMIYHNYKRYKYIYGPTHVMGQIGRAFRFEKSSQRTCMRCWQFTQMELQIFTRERSLVEMPKLKYCVAVVTDSDKTYLGRIPSQISKYLKIHDTYMRLCDLKYRLCILEKTLPHYSRFTVDVEVLLDGVWREMASINDRGFHDNVVMGCKPGDISVIEFSYGLDRLFWAMTMNNFDGQSIRYPKDCRISGGLLAIHKNADTPEIAEKYLPRISYKKIVKLSKIKNEKKILAYDKYYVAYTNKLEYLDENFNIVHTVKYGQ